MNIFRKLDQLPGPWIEQEQQLESLVSVHPSLHTVTTFHPVTSDYIAPSDPVITVHTQSCRMSRIPRIYPCKKVAKCGKIG